MSIREGSIDIRQATVAVALLLATTAVTAGGVYQPPGSNLTFGDVTHGQRVQSASTNPAAAAADLVRGDGKSTRGTVVSASAGLEYGNIEDLFDFYDRITVGHKPSEPDDGGGGPGQEPDDKPDFGIDLGEIWDALDPDIQDAVNTIAKEVAAQAAILALIQVEGYGRAWLAADAPFVLGNEYLGGAWTFGVSWSGTAKAFGIVEAIDFDEDAAREALEDWFSQLPINRPVQLPVSDEVLLAVEPVTNAVRFAINNDSSIVSKASQLAELNFGYSRLGWTHELGSLFLGTKARLYLMRLSRLSVRFGDITDSEELFDAITDNDFRDDTRLGVDVGALWVANNYQIGAQITNLNEPKFQFPDVNLDPYRNEEIIGFLQRDQTYEMDRQLKLEASMFTKNRHWSAHLGIDVDPATDALGDDYQWLTLSAGYTRDSWWVPSVRFGYRANLAGTEMEYLSVGLTAFKIVNFDLASALDSVSIDGQDLPQGLMASIGFQITW